MPTSRDFTRILIIFETHFFFPPKPRCMKPARLLNHFELKPLNEWETTGMKKKMKSVSSSSLLCVRFRKSGTLFSRKPIQAGHSVVINTEFRLQREQTHFIIFMVRAITGTSVGATPNPSFVLGWSSVGNSLESGASNCVFHAECLGSPVFSPAARAQELRISVSAPFSTSLHPLPDG